MNIAVLFDSSQVMEATEMSTNRWMNEEDVQWDITESKKKNVFDSVLEKWLNLSLLYRVK